MTGREHISLLGGLQGRLCTHGSTGIIGQNQQPWEWCAALTDLTSAREQDPAGDEIAEIYVMVVEMRSRSSLTSHHCRLIFKMI
ncbi:hypothetical protein WJX84_000250 [Apatococcus fuscideae]|uniref:Uncharacterized protein n=1 Tax=Apatococcus fuscideae TaxID=2026836 RepID=A0AAW1SXZ1_9CHLO